MPGDSPSVVILAGPNGAGKTTASPFVIRDTLGIREFVNADHIAQGLSGFAPETTAIAAGRIMLGRLHELGRKRATFAFETTLATRSFAPWLRGLREDGYTVRLVFLALPTPELAIGRVRLRVSQGGHDVPEAVIRRRFRRGLTNLFGLYAEIANEWSIYDSSGATPRAVYESEPGTTETIHDAEQLEALKRLA
ncbi:MAG: zeta toxin family protein [Planctomycetota bacterium]